MTTDMNQTTPASQLRAGVEDNDVEAVSAALEAGASARTRGGWGYPLLSQAAGDGKMAIVELLLKAGADTEADKEQCLDNQAGSGETCFYSGPTALQYAVQRGHIHVVKLLLSHGADPSGYNGLCQPMYEAVTRSRAKILRVLHAHGARFLNERQLLDAKSVATERGWSEVLDWLGSHPSTAALLREAQT
jgi:ankyrin repeat protein